MPEKRVVAEGSNRSRRSIFFHQRAWVCGSNPKLVQSITSFPYIVNSL
jgi:hypothetical protein